MIVAVFRRRLTEGATFEDFIDAWEADQGFGVPARVLNAVSMEDPREVISIGFVDVEPIAFAGAVEGVAAQEEVRHSRIDAVIESTVLRAFYDLKTEHDFSAEPRQIDRTSAESLLASFR